MTEPPWPLVQMSSDFANPSLCLDTNDTMNVARLCEGAKQFLRLHIEGLDAANVSSMCHPVTHRASSARRRVFGCEVHVIADLLYRAGGSLVSNEVWQPLASLEAVLPRKLSSSMHTPKTEKEEEVEVVAEAWWHYPAMWEFLTAPAATNTKKRLRTKVPRPAPAAGGRPCWCCHGWRGCC